MLRILGLTLMLIGLVVTGWGIAGALGELVGMYSSALNDPMASPTTATGEEGEQAVADAMIEHVMFAALGVPALVVGSLLAVFGRKRKRRPLGQR